MKDPRIQLRDPWIAALLAFLIPGAGHLYQRRTFKGVLYMVCILGTFLYGMHLGDWRAVYMRNSIDLQRMRQTGRMQSRLVWGYLAQFGVGLPALPAVVQSRRYHTLDNLRPTGLEAPLQDVQADGELFDPTATTFLEVSGKLSVDINGKGHFTGTTSEGQAIDADLGGFDLDHGEPAIDPKVSAEPKRSLEFRVFDRDSAMLAGKLRVQVDRPVVNWFQVPPTESALGEMHRMGKSFDLAQVFTWIAGLLNILAIWDAYDGPAYGYGDEEEEPSDDDKKSAENTDKPDTGQPQPEPAAQTS